MTQETRVLFNETCPVCRFEIDAYKKRCLQNGYDDVDYLCSISDQIRRFEEARK